MTELPSAKQTQNALPTPPGNPVENLCPIPHRPTEKNTCFALRKYPVKKHVTEFTTRSTKIGECPSGTGLRFAAAVCKSHRCRIMRSKERVDG